MLHFQHNPVFHPHKHIFKPKIVTFEMKGSCRHFCFVTFNCQNEQELNNPDQSIQSKLLSASFRAPMIPGVHCVPSECQLLLYFVMSLR